MAANPWRSDVLPLKTVELIGVALNAACTNLNADGARRHIRAALAAGASRDEVLMVLKMDTLLADPLLQFGYTRSLEEARAAGVPLPDRSGVAAGTPICDAARRAGQWNEAWTPFFNLDPAWTERVVAAGLPAYADTWRLLSQRRLPLSIAFDASITHMTRPEPARHINAALAHGASAAEVMEVLKLCVAQGVQACNLGVPILAEELERAGAPV